MYKVKIDMDWSTECKARLWCKDNFILFRLDDSSNDYEKTRELDVVINESYIDILSSDFTLRRVFCFKYEEDVVAFKLRWL